MVRNVSINVSLTDISARQISGIRKVLVLYRFTTVYGSYASPGWLTSVNVLLSPLSENKRTKR